jgi:hypothetical protein
MIWGRRFRYRTLETHPWSLTVELCNNMHFAETARLRGARSLRQSCLADESANGVLEDLINSATELISLALERTYEVGTSVCYLRRDRRLPSQQACPGGRDMTCLWGIMVGSFGLNKLESYEAGTLWWRVVRDCDLFRTCDLCALKRLAILAKYYGILLVGCFAVRNLDISDIWNVEDRRQSL